MEIIVKEKDIVFFNHEDDYGKKRRHPFLILEVAVDHFLAAQVTSINYDKNGNFVFNEWQQQILAGGNYIDVDINDGFKYHSLILLDSIYEVKFGKNLFELKVVGEFKSDIKFQNIKLSWKNINGIPLKWSDFSPFGHIR